MRQLNFARYVLVLPLIFGVVFADKSCDIPLGDLGEFVIQYQLTVTNSTVDDALLSIQGDDVKEQAVVRPGGSITGTSYKGGFFIIGADGPVDVVAELQRNKADIEAQLAQKPLSVTQAQQLDQQLQTVNGLLKQARNTLTLGVCWSTLKPDEHGQGGEYDYTAAMDDQGKYSVSGFCAT
jgi:hypothetical protein